MLGLTGKCGFAVSRSGDARLSSHAISGNVIPFLT
jgi:hypothetical protein